MSGKEAQRDRNGRAGRVALRLGAIALLTCGSCVGWAASAGAEGADLTTSQISLSGTNDDALLAEHGSRYVWRATSPAPDSLVAVDAGRVCYVLSPQDAQAFRHALIERADVMPAESPTSARTDLGWLDRVAVIDGWVRTLLVIGVLLAGALLKFDLVRSGAPQADTLAAIVILGVNAALALGFSGQSLAVARLLSAGALALEVVAILW